MTNTAITALASARKRTGRIWPEGDMQNERRRYMKYAGCRMFNEWCIEGGALRTARYMYICLKLRRTANSTPLASLLPWKLISGCDTRKYGLVTDIAGHEDWPKQNTKHESIILEVYMIHNEKSGMKEQRCRYNTLHKRVSSSSDEPREITYMKMDESLCRFQNTYRVKAEPRTSSDTMTVHLWYAMTDHASYFRLLSWTIAGSTNAAPIDRTFSK